MSGINKVILLGRIQESPELETLINLERVLSFSLTTVERINKTGKIVEHTEQHHIVMRGA